MRSKECKHETFEEAISMVYGRIPKAEVASAMNAKVIVSLAGD